MLKSLKFFRKQKQFQKPPKVLLSSSFISYMLSSKKSTHHHLVKILGMKVTLFATRCVVNQTEFGNELSDQALTNLKIKKICCSHKGKWDEINCLLSAVQGGNEEGYFLATGSEDYVNMLQEAEMVPVIFCNGSEIILKKPSEYQEELAAADGSGRAQRGRHAGRHGGIGRYHRRGGRAL